MTFMLSEVEDYVWGYVTDADEHDLALADILAQARKFFTPDESDSQ